MKLYPNQGGCWFCHTDDDSSKWLFSLEFDCNVHKDCLQKEINKEQPSEEAVIMASEFGMKKAELSSGKK